MTRRRRRKEGTRKTPRGCAKCQWRGWAVDPATNTATPCECRERGEATREPTQTEVDFSEPRPKKKREFPAHTRARTTDPPTSHAAAERVTRFSGNWPNLSASQWQVYNALRQKGPMTDEELYRHLESRGDGYEQSRSGARTRRAELVEVELVRDSGTTRETLRGNDATVWEWVSPWARTSAGAGG